MNLQSTKRRLRQLLHIVKRALALLSGFYGVGLSLFLLLRPLVGDRWVLVALGNSFLPLLMLPALILLPVALVGRRWRLALSVTPIVAIFALSYGSQFLPRSANTAPDISGLSLLTYNIHEEANDLDPMIAIIREADADVVALQEVSYAAAETFADIFAAAYPYQALHPNGGWAGQGVLSRYPLRSDEYWQLWLGHQRVEIDVGDKLVTLYNIHPIHPFLMVNGRGFDIGPRGEAIATILERAAQDAGPVLIVGDFNMSDQTDDYRRITAQYVDSYLEVGWGLGFTFPDLQHMSALPLDVPFPLPVPPLTRLDYVFHSKDIHGIEARVWPTSGGSDHRPVLVKLR